MLQGFSLLEVWRHLWLVPEILLEEGQTVKCFRCGHASHRGGSSNWIWCRHKACLFDIRGACPEFIDMEDDGMNEVEEIIEDVLDAGIPGPDLFDHSNSATDAKKRAEYEKMAEEDKAA